MTDRLYTLNRQFFYPLLAIAIMAGMISSLFLLSLAQFLLFFLWIAEGHYKEKKNLLKNPLPWLLAGVFFIHIIGLAWTQDWNYAFKDLRIKLPVLALPIIFASIGPLPGKSWKFILTAFQWIIVIMFLITLIFFLIEHDFQLYDLRIFRNHIRLSLLLAILNLLSLHRLFYEKNSKGLILLSIITIGISFILVFAISSLNGLLILFISQMIFAFILLFKKANFHALLFIIPMLCFFAFFIYQIIQVKKVFFPSEIEEITMKELSLYNENGRPYIHIPENSIRENGKIVYLYIQPEECIKEWNKRSVKKLDSSTFFSDPTASLIFRYMTTKDLRKDSAGIAKLSNSDIKNIESGCPNIKLRNVSPLIKRLYSLLFEMHEPDDIGNVNGSSLRQRFLYWNISLKLISENPFFGVGTGDPAKTFEQYYKKNYPQIEKRYRFRSHNQYLAMAVSLGVVGFILFLVFILSPFVLLKKEVFRHYIPWFLFFIIFALSLLTEDTLESQVGVTLYAFFNSFLLFFQPIDQKS